MLNLSIQTCMDTSSDWLKGIVHEETAIMDSSSSSPSTELISCSSRPPPPAMVERRLRPQQDQALKCPRCDSTHTKFCYYNNYSLSQPRYFCKTCRRYWTKGGSLRNVPVGGGCRKNKRSGSGKKVATDHHHHHPQLHQYQAMGSASFHDGTTGTDLHLSTFSGLLPPISHFNSLSGGGPRSIGNFMECKYDDMFDGQDQVGDDKFGAMLGNPRGQIFHMGSLGGSAAGFGDGVQGFSTSTTFHGMSPLGFSMEGTTVHGSSLMDTCQRLALPFDGNDAAATETKPNGKLLSLDWQEQGCADVGRDSFGYSNGVGLWGGMVNGHGSSTSNPLV